METQITETLIISPKFLSSNLRNYLLTLLKDHENKCCNDGVIKKVLSIAEIIYCKIVYSTVYVSLKYNAIVLNPSIGDIIDGKIFKIIDSRVYLQCGESSTIRALLNDTGEFKYSTETKEFSNGTNQLKCNDTITFKVKHLQKKDNVINLIGSLEKWHPFIDKNEEVKEKQSITELTSIDRLIDDLLGKDETVEKDEVVEDKKDEVIEDKKDEVEERNESATIIYTDGGCANNGYPNAVAGAGVFFGYNDPRNISCSVPGEQTNNRGELWAIIQALNSCSDELVEIRTDSLWAINCITGVFKAKANLDLLQTLWEIIKTRKIIFQHVSGHSHEPGNDEADKLASIGITKSVNKQ